MLPLTSNTMASSHRTVRLRFEADNRPTLAAFDDDEVALRQVGHEPALAVAHDRRDRHEIDRGLKRAPGRSAVDPPARAGSPVLSR